MGKDRVAVLWDQQKRPQQEGWLWLLKERNNEKQCVRDDDTKSSHQKLFVVGKHVQQNLKEIL